MEHQQYDRLNGLDWLFILLLTALASKIWHCYHDDAEPTKAAAEVQPEERTTRPGV